MKKLTLNDLFDVDTFHKDVAAGFIRVQTHPTLPLSIANYSEKCVFGREWRATTLRSRGLIFQSETLEVIASGVEKFFNLGQTEAPHFPIDAKARVTTKFDGSLGIGYKYEDHYGIATRGSFASDQAIHATQRMHELNLEPDIDYANERGLTRLFEVIFPQNRIVLDYGDRDELVNLGTVDNASGKIIYRPSSMYVSQATTLGVAASLPVPDDEEGYVLDVEHEGSIHHLKIKGQHYIDLHSVIFGLTERKVWEQLKAGTETGFIAQLPDELHDWANNTVTKLNRQYMDIYYDVAAAITEKDSFGFTTRRDLAQWIMTTYPKLSSPLFLASDDRYDLVQDWIMEQIRPNHIPFSSVPAFVNTLT